MSSFTSQSINPTPPKPTLPLLTGAVDYPIYLKELKILLRTNFGVIGQSILNKIPVDLVLPGPAPHYDDPRINPRSKQPIYGSRMYTQVEPTEEENNDPLFDDSDLDLTPSSKDLLAKNTEAYLDRVAISNKKLEKYREIDDSLLNLLYSTQTAAVKEILNSNTLTAAFIALPPYTINRSEKYLEILSNQFSKGNSRANINEITKFLSLTQDLDETEAAWTNRAYEHYNRVEPILSPATSVEILLKMLLCMVIIKGTSRRKHSNMRAIEIHVQKYPDLLDSLQHLEELRTGILAGVDSDLNNTDDPISSQSSAFKAALEPPVALAATTIIPPPQPKQPKQPRTPKDPLKGTQKAGRTDHCTYCLTNFSKYFYHKTQDCTLKKRGITAATPHSANMATTAALPSEEQVKAYFASLGLVLSTSSDAGDEEA